MPTAIRTAIFWITPRPDPSAGIGVNSENIRIGPETKFLDPLDKEKAEIRA